MNIKQTVCKKLLRPSPLLGAFVAVAILALLLFVYNITRPVPMAGSKTITIDVIYPDGHTDSYKTTTEEQFLQEAAETIPGLTIEGTVSEEFGLMVITVNGVRADYNQDGAYWELLLDGEPCSYGISMQPIKDGEQYSIVYTAADQQERR